MAAQSPATIRRSTEEWRRQLQGKPVEAAHEIHVADGTVEAYEAFVELYTQGPFAVEARIWLNLHRRMAAWNEAVLVNTAVSYRGFLAEYPQSDLTATAYRLIERLNNRPTIAPVVTAAPSSYTPPAPISKPQVGTSKSHYPTNGTIDP